MNKIELQTLINNTPLGATLYLPAGEHVIDAGLVAGAIIRVPRSISIIGNNTALRFINVAPATQAFKIDAPDKSVVEFRDLTIHGPETAIEGQNDSMSCIHWALYKTPLASLHVSRVKVTGFFESAVQRAGGGFLTITDCDFHAWEGTVKFFASHGESGKLYLGYNKLSGLGSKYTSIGAYVHNNLSMMSEGNEFSDFNYHGLSSHGSPAAGSKQSWVSSNDTFIRTPMVQTPSLRAVIINPVCQGVVSRGSLIRGDAIIIGGNINDTNFTFSTDVEHNFDMIDCVWAPKAIPLVVGGKGRFRFFNVVWNLEGSGRVFTTHRDSTALIEMNGAIINDISTKGPYLLQTQGAVTIDWGKTVFNTNRPDALNLHPATKQIGTPTILKKV